MNKRLNFIDIARAFAIIFIVLGHTITYSMHCELIYKILCSFHVVLFFVLSGYTFNIKEKSFLIFLKQKFSRIMIPYYTWAILFLVPYMLFGQAVASSTGAKGNFNILIQFLKIFYGNGNEQGLKQNTSLWFLPALFSMELVYYWIIKKVENKNNKIKTLVIIPIFIISYISYQYLEFIFPMGLNTVLHLGIFFYIGYLFKTYKLFNKEKIFKIYYMIPILILGLISGILNIQISVVNYKYGNQFLAIISGIFLSIITIYIAYLINKNKYLEYIGKNTMHILIFHKLIIIIFQTKLGLISNILKNSNLFVELIMSLIITILSIKISLIILKVIEKTKEIKLFNKNNAKTYTKY